MLKTKMEVDALLIFFYIMLKHEQTFMAAAILDFDVASQIIFI